MGSTGSRLVRLSCRACCAEFPPGGLVRVCGTCGHTLSAEYDVAGLDGRRWWATIRERPPGLWRYRELLPVQDDRSIVSLGEAESAILPLEGPAGMGELQLQAKDDGALPTGSFKARGMTVAVSRARELGASRLFAPSAGNAGLALAAYGARAGLPVVVYLPERTEPAVTGAIARFGAEVVRLGATIREAGEEGRRREASRSFDMSTLREPYRVEGKKTMAFEILDRTGPEGMPDAIVYPTGGGTGLVGLKKGFEELRSLGLIDKLPRLISVQATGCAPIVRALQQEQVRAAPWVDAATLAPGLLVPAPFSSERVLEAVRTTRGTGATVSDAQIVEAQRELARRFGLSVSLEAAAPWAALPGLARDGAVRSGERILLYITGRGTS